MPYRLLSRGCAKRAIADGTNGSDTRFKKGGDDRDDVSPGMMLPEKRSRWRRKDE
jgi:hypothetical protein